MTPREKQLLETIADQIEDGSAILTHDWLAENQVTLDEMRWLCAQIAQAIRNYTTLSDFEVLKKISFK